MSTLRSLTVLSRPGGFRRNVSRTADRTFLLSELVRRDLTARFVGSIGGPLWVFLNPLIFSVIYGFVFAIILRTRPPAGFPGYAEFLLSGLLPWIGFQEAIMRNTSAVTEHAHLVKKLPFPPALLVVSSLISALAIQAAGVGLLAAYVLMSGRASLHPVCLIGAFGFEIVLLVGPAFILAALQVFVRDLVQILGPAMTILFYLTPVVYPAALVPEPYARWMALNPLRDLVTLFRAGLCGTELPPLPRLLAWALASVVLAWLGERFFRRCQRSFSDLL